MNVVTQLVLMTLLVIVFRIAALFTTSGDWRDCALGWIVIIVYVSIGIFYAARYIRRRRN